MKKGTKAGHLVTVPCHSSYLGGDPYRDENWVLLEYQKGNAKYWVEHIYCGIDIAVRDPSSLLVFSGGFTRVGVGPRCESQSYWDAAEYLHWFARPRVTQRCSMETEAVDSMTNVLFSICKYKECTGEYPSKITVVGWEFKSARFAMHRDALRIPEARFIYLGINNPDPWKLQAAIDGEARVREAFEADPYAIGEGLGGKREGRNPWFRHHGYAASCPEVAELLGYRDSELFNGPLPWAGQGQLGVRAAPMDESVVASR